MSEIELLKQKIEHDEYVIEYLKQALIAEYADQYRTEGERGSKALEMAKEDAEHQLTIAINTATERIRNANPA